MSGVPRKMSVYRTAIARSGKRGAPRQAAHDRDQQRQWKHDRLGDEHQLDVELEAAPDLRRGAKEVERIEELMQELAQLDLLRVLCLAQVGTYFRTGTFAGS